MLLVKTTSLERYKLRQEQLKSMKGKYFKRFAWLPTTLSCGRVIWLELYYYRWRIKMRCSTKELYTSSRTCKITKEDYQELIKENK